MKKIKVCRASGLPVLQEHHEEYKEAYRTLYDKIMKRLSMTETSIPDQAIMARFDKLLARSSRLLLRNFPTVSEWPLLTSKKETKRLIREHGPIAIAIDGETSDLAYVILDDDFLVR